LPSRNLDATRQNGDAHTTSVGAGTVVRKLMSVGSFAEPKQHILQAGFVLYGMALASARYRRAMTRNELNRVSIAAVIFLVVFTLLTYAAVKFRRGVGNVGREPAQIYGSTQIELAWTVIPDRQGVNALTCVEPIDGNGYLSLIEVSRPRRETVVPMGYSSRRARG
jgi:hypothetical protein